MSLGNQFNLGTVLGTKRKLNYFNDNNIIKYTW